MSISSGILAACAVEGAPARALAEGFSGFSWCPPTPRLRRASRPRHIRRSERQPSHPNKITGGDDILRGGMRTLDAEITRLAEAARRLGPTENLLDLPAALLTELMRLRAHLHAQQPTIFHRGRMRHDTLAAQPFNKVARAIAAIRSDRVRGDPALLQLSDLLHGHFRVGAGGWLDLEQHAQPVAVFHRGVPSEGELGFAAVTFAHQLRFGIGRRLVRVVAPLLAFEVRPAVAVAAPTVALV